MKTKKKSRADGTTASNPDEARIQDYKTQFDSYLNVLQDYHVNRFNRNYLQYTAYTQTKGTHTKISDPVAPELVERVIQKMFQRDPKFYAMARGKAVPPEITKLMEAACEYLWTNPDITQETGTMRSKLKMAGREFCVLGNCCVETFYNGIADGPDIRIIPLEDVIFDPTKGLKRSKRYYIRQYVSIEDLKANQEITKDGKVTAGIFKNIKELEESLSDAKNFKNDPSAAQVNRFGSYSLQQPVEKILLVSCWDGKKLCQIANWTYIVREVDDPMLIGDDPLDFAMDIEVPKVPFGFSLLDFINGLTNAKDLLINQVVDYGSKALNPPLFVDPSVAANVANRSSLRNAYKVGGMVFANPSQVGHLPMPQLPAVGMELMSYIQQRSESVTGVGAYLGGVPNQVSDQTKGTKGGIEALISQAASPVLDRQQNLEEAIIEPVINKMLKMTGELMGGNEEKWIFISGQERKWVKITQGLLTGKITLPDLVVSGLISQEDAQQAQTTLTSQGKNPDNHVIFDVDWIIRVETGSMAELDSAKDLENFDSTINAAIQTGVPIDAIKVWKERAMRAGVKEPEQYLLPQAQGDQPQPAQTPQSGKQPASTGPSSEELQLKQLELQMKDKWHEEDLKLKAHEIDTKAEIQHRDMVINQPKEETPESPQHPLQKVSESMNFKDLPFEAQNAMLEGVGLPATAKEPPVPVKATASTTK